MEEYVKVFRLAFSRPAIYEKLQFNSFSEHGVNISKEEVALYFSSKVSFLKLRSSRAWACLFAGFKQGTCTRRPDGSPLAGPYLLVKSQAKHPDLLKSENFFVRWQPEASSTDARKG